MIVRHIVVRQPVQERAGEADVSRNAMDGDLLSGLRAGREAAIRELFDRYTALLLRAAVELGVGRNDAWTYAAEVLGDVAMEIGEHRLVVHGSLRAYLIVRLRNRVLADRRVSDGRARLEREIAMPAQDAGPGSEAAVLSTCSSHALRASRDPLGEFDPEAEAGEDACTSTVPASETAAPSASAAALAALHAVVQAGLTPEQARIMNWVAERVPHREMAAWLGTTEEALRARVKRIRARLVARAARFQASLEGEAGVAVGRHLRRWRQSAPQRRQLRERAVSNGTDSIGEEDA